MGIAAAETLKLLPGGGPSCGVALELDKGLPLGSGMGSSAASAAAACWAVNKLFGEPIKKEKLVLAGLQSEAYVSGYHADNIAPALLGGFILIRCARPPPRLGPVHHAITAHSTGLILARSRCHSRGGPAGDSVFMRGQQHTRAASQQPLLGAIHASECAHTRLGSCPTHHCGSQLLGLPRGAFAMLRCSERSIRCSDSNWSDPVRLCHDPCMCRSAEPLDIQLLKPDEGYCKDLLFVLVTPTFEAPTREMRAALPAEVPFKSMVANSVAGASLVRPSCPCLRSCSRCRGSG